MGDDDSQGNIKNTLALLERAAKLSRVEMTSSEMQALVPKAQSIFGAFGTLSDLDTSGIEPLYTFRESLELRADDACGVIATKKLFSIAPEYDSNHYVVPRVVGGDDVI